MLIHSPPSISSGAVALSKLGLTISDYYCPYNFKSKLQLFNGLQQMQASDITRMIEKLPTGYRTVFNLYTIEGYSHKEIAAELGISINTSKSQYSRARAYLQKELAKTESSWTNER